MKRTLVSMALLPWSARALAAAVAQPSSGVAAFERATGLTLLHLSDAVAVVDKPEGLRSVPAYGPTDALLADYAARRDAGEADLAEKFERPTRRDRWIAVARDLEALPPALRRRWESLPRTRNRFLKFCAGPAGGRLDETQSEAAWLSLKEAVAAKEVEEGMEESDSVLRRVQREAGFPDACPVHRLDYATSGCLAVALTPEAAGDLSAQWRARTVSKAYEAVVAGAVARDSGAIDLPLKRVDAPKRKGLPSRVVVAADGKASRSSYAVLSRGRVSSVLELEPHTGRLHQLRAHCAALGHPILGDWLYGDGTTSPRLCLHASRLAFDDPATNARVHVNSRAAWDASAVDGGGAPVLRYSS